MKCFCHLTIVGSLLILLAGCSSLPDRVPLAMMPVEPDPDEMRVTEQVVLLVDASSSMMQADKFPVARSTAEAIVGAMPEGDYGFGLIAFGGKEDVVHPIEPFLRLNASTNTRSLEPLGGITPIGEALDVAGTLLTETTGRSAVILISDVRTTNVTSTMAAAQDLVAAHDDLCLFTIQVGWVAGARDLMTDITSLSACGAAYTDQQLQDPALLKELIRQAFFAAAPDSDGDGVYDRHDECPDTPQGATVDERGCWVLPGVLFDYDKAVLQPGALPLFTPVISVLQDNPGLRLHIDGHTDAIGSQAYNLDLSQRRAHAVRSYLIEEGGIDADRLVARGFGKTRPLVPNITEENRALNRRVELSPIN